MFIQCQHCHTTYKIDENKIPEKESVVRCAKCSEPIPLNPEQQDEVLRKTPKKIVECDNCGTQYSVPLNSLSKPEIKARCGNCGSFFSIASSASDIEAPALSAQDYEDNDIDLDNIDIPEESEIEVDNLFDDIDAGKENLENKNRRTADKLSSQQASNEYQESVKLTSENGHESELPLDEEEPDINEISEEQKYKIFLKPKSKQESASADDLDSSWPDIEDEIIDEELNTFSEPEIDEFTDLEALGKSPKSPGKDKKKPKKKKRNILLWIIWIFVIIAVIAVGWLYFNLKTEEFYTAPQSDAFENQSKIAILEPLNGRFLQNKNLSTKMFVLEGKLLNIYGENVLVSGIEIEGYLYRKNSDQPITAISYAGVYLDDDLLKIGSKENIEEIIKELAEEVTTGQEFGADDLIDFQVIFFDAPDTQDIEKLGARIKKFNRKEL
jgi:predicted Zn finger-like uncharacterized protein